jgi:hypothetical protein
MFRAEEGRMRRAMAADGEGLPMSARQVPTTSPSHHLSPEPNRASSGAVKPIQRQQITWIVCSIAAVGSSRAILLNSAFWSRSTLRPGRA